jgi:hypothetical protein
MRRWLIFLLVVLAPAVAPATELAATLERRHVVGYQGWFACPGDAVGRWVHWFQRMPDGRELPRIDLLPDTSELAAGEGCPTPWHDAAGRPIRLFTAQDPRTVDRHFAWMAQYGLHTAAAQRFLVDLRRPEGRAQFDRVLANVRAGAEAHGRAFFVMYDLSRATDADLPRLVEDWRRQVAGGLVASPSYQRHAGHPVLGLWGLGFSGRPITPAATLETMRALQAATPGGLTFLGGVPTNWRTGDGDAEPGGAWHPVFRALGVVSPWTIGRYLDEAGADGYAQGRLRADMQAARQAGQDLLPVIYPGFSASNVRASLGQQAPMNRIPRACGRFYWHQAAQFVNGGARMLYTAMFDEVDEGTAIFKLAPSAQLPREGRFLGIDADGCALPTDWYLQLARGISRGLEAGRMRPNLQ